MKECMDKYIKEQITTTNAESVLYLGDIEQDFKQWYRIHYYGAVTPDKDMIKRELTRRWGYDHGQWIGLTFTHPGGNMFSTSLIEDIKMLKEREKINKHNELIQCHSE